MLFFGVGLVGEGCLGKPGLPGQRQQMKFDIAADAIGQRMTFLRLGVCMNHDRKTRQLQIGDVCRRERGDGVLYCFFSRGSPMCLRPCRNQGAKLEVFFTLAIAARISPRSSVFA